MNGEQRPELVPCVPQTMGSVWGVRGRGRRRWIWGLCQAAQQRWGWGPRGSEGKGPSAREGTSENPGPSQSLAAAHKAGLGDGKPRSVPPLLPASCPPLSEGSGGRVLPPHKCTSKVPGPLAVLVSHIKPTGVLGEQAEARRE